MNLENKLQVCVPVCASTIVALKEAVVRAGSVADIVELRLDCLFPAELERVNELYPFLTSAPVPVILTLRPKEQGGNSALDLASRDRFWVSCPGSDLFRDLELDLLEGRQNASRPYDQLICSHHDFSQVATDLEAIYDRMSATPAGILKLAVQANDVTDCIPIFQLLRRARREQREMIAIAMGPAGIATRILGPSRGAFLTYAALEEKSATATGQLTVAELKSLYRIDRINQETPITGLIGLPVMHSVSPHMHNAALEAAGRDGVYIPFPVRDVTGFLKRMVHPRTREMDWNIRGLSVTSPYKSAVMSSLDWVEPTAAELGAVNTIVAECDELHGYNTDGFAFSQVVKDAVGELRNARCAVIGSGGAARAILWSFKQAAANTTVFARNEAQSKALAAEFGAGYESLNNASFATFDLVINATPLGTAGHLQERTPAIAAQLRGARLAGDLVYNPLETRFLREARAAGCQTLGGLPMLVKQALKQFQLWTGIEASEHAMSHAAHEALTAR
jgi:3-dehydroquinate dehydratase / shikimate dehydrogenase